jgi:hypothetical protein
MTPDPQEIRLPRAPNTWPRTAPSAHLAKNRAKLTAHLAKNCAKLTARPIRASRRPALATTLVSPLARRDALTPWFEDRRHDAPCRLHWRRGLNGSLVDLDPERGVKSPKRWTSKTRSVSAGTDAMRLAGATSRSSTLRLPGRGGLARHHGCGREAEKSLYGSTTVGREAFWRRASGGGRRCEPFSRRC